MNNINFYKINNKTINNQNRINTNINNKTRGISFDKILKIERDKGIKISKHAMERMNLRNINFNDDDMNKIENAITMAKSKGVKEALILMGDIAMIASTKNKTIITTVNAEQLKNNVFTNIDGAVII